MSSEMVRASSRVRTELTSVGLFLGVDTLVTLQMARPDRLVGCSPDTCSSSSILSLKTGVLDLTTAYACTYREGAELALAQLKDQIRMNEWKRGTGSHTYGGP